MTSSTKRSRSSIVGVAGGVGGFAAGGFVHSLLPLGNIWLRAAITGASVVVAGTLIGLVAYLLVSRQAD